MSLLVRLGRGLQGFMGGGTTIGPKVLQQTLTTSGTYTPPTPPREHDFIVVRGGANGTPRPAQGTQSPSVNGTARGGTGGASGAAVFGAVDANSPLVNAPSPFTIGGVGGNSSFSNNLDSTNASPGSVSGGTGGVFNPPSPGNAGNVANYTFTNRNFAVGSGGGGGTFFQYDAVNDSPNPGGAGGSSPVAQAGNGGAGGASGVQKADSSIEIGQPGSPGLRGGGGGGAGGNVQNNPAPDRNGGAGGAGVIYVYYGTES